MVVEINLNLDTADFDLSMAEAQKRLLTMPPIEARSPLNLTCPAPFVETGTLRASYGASGAFARSCEWAARAAERNARLYEAFQQMADDLYKTLEIVEPVLWRIQRPWVMFKWGSVLTLVIVMVTIWNG